MILNLAARQSHLGKAFKNDQTPRPTVRGRRSPDIHVLDASPEGSTLMCSQAADILTYPSRGLSCEVTFHLGVLFFLNPTRKRNF